MRASDQMEMFFSELNEVVSLLSTTLGNVESVFEDGMESMRKNADVIGALSMAILDAHTMGDDEGANQFANSIVVLYLLGYADGKKSRN